MQTSQAESSTRLRIVFQKNDYGTVPNVVLPVQLFLGVYGGISRQSVS